MFFQARHFLQSLSILKLLCKLDVSGITDDCWQVHICYNQPILKLYLVDLVDRVFSHNWTFQIRVNSLPYASSWVLSLCNLSHLCMYMGSGQFPDPCFYHFHTVQPVDIVGMSYITEYTNKHSVISSCIIHNAWQCLNTQSTMITRCISTTMAWANAVATPAESWTHWPRWIHRELSVEYKTSP